MRVRCPKCEESFNAKINARRIKCPACGFREDAPEGGFGEAFTSGKRRPGGFQPEQAAGGGSQSTPGTWIAVGAVVLLLVAGAAAWLVFGQGGAPAAARSCPQLDTADVPVSNPANPVAVLDLGTDGCLAIELFADKAPVTAGNFRSLVEKGFYDGTKFHRVIKDFMMQGGDPNSKDADPGNDGGGGPGYEIEDEFHPALRHDQPGRLSMANSGPNTGGSQFFIIFVPTPHLDGLGPSGEPKPCGTRQQDGQRVSCHAVFGQVVVGMDIVQRINQEAGNPADGPPLRPVTFVSARMRGAPGATAPTGATSAPPATSSPPSGPPQVCEDMPVGPPAPAQEAVAADLITPGIWNVCGDREHMYIWVHNNSTSVLPYAWNVTGPGGSPLPPGWSVTFQTPSGVLQPGGTRGTAPNGRATYPDWAATLATLTLPADTGPMHFPAELRVGGGIRPFIFHVQGPRGAVSQPGEQVTTCYDLKGQDGRDIQKGPFPLQVAGQGAVPGYAYGTAGVAMGETVVLVVPPPFAYPEGNPPDIQAWETLRWSAKIVSDASTCPR